MTSPREHPIDGLPNDLASAHALILAQREMLAAAQNEAKVRALEIERLKLQLAKARREHFGQLSERSKLLVEQLELAIEDLEETQAEKEAKAEIAAPEPAKAQRRRPQRGPRKLPDNLPVERVVEPAPCVWGKCGSSRLRKLGESLPPSLPRGASPGRLNANQGAGRSSSLCAKNSLAEITKQSASRRHPRIRSRAVSPAQAY